MWYCWRILDLSKKSFTVVYILNVTFLLVICNFYSKGCDICHYWHFKDIGFKYEPYICNGCHDLMQKAMSFNNVAIVYVKGSAYKIHFWYMSKDDAIKIMNGSNLVDRRGVLSFYIYIYIYISK